MTISQAPSSYWGRRSELGQVLRHALWACREAVTRAPLLAAGSVALALVSGLSPAATVRITQRLINLGIALAGHGAGGFGRMLPWLGALALALLLDAGVTWRVKYDVLERRLRDHLTYALEHARLQKAARLPLLRFQQSETFDLLERAGDPGVRAGELFSNTVDTLQYTLQALTVVALFAAVFWWLPLVLLLALALQSARSLEGNRQWMAFTYDQTEEQRRLLYVNGLLVGRDEQKEIRVFDLLRGLTERWQSLRVRLRAQMIAEKLRITRLNIGADGAALALIIGVAFLLVLRLAEHALSPGAFVALFGGLGLLQNALPPLLQSVQEMQSGTTDVGYVRELLALPEPAPAPAGGRPFPRPLREGLRCEGLRFTYPGREAPVLDGLDLHLRAGEVVALVGENGCGKSTLAKCLLGLYAPEQGRITADGLDYREIAPESLTAAVTAAYQDYVNFALTLGESIALGDPTCLAAEGGFTAPGSEGGVPARVAAAARLGGAAAVADALPQGYATPIGHVLDGAADLSGGQWQRIAIARAFVKDAQFVVLDEPTAALDPRAEAELYARFGALLAGRTALLITHRLGSARLADRIVVLRAGRIAEEGRHADLLRAGGQYARMWEEQAQWYR